MSEGIRSDAVVEAVDAVARRYGTTSDMLYARPSQVRDRYQAHRSIRRTVWEALVTQGVVPASLADGSKARTFRTRCPCCQGRGTVPSYSEYYEAYLVSRGRQLRDPCAVCRRDRRHYGPGWVEDDFPMSSDAMVAVALLAPRLLQAEASAKEIGRLVLGQEPPMVAWHVAMSDRWPKDARRTMLRALRRSVPADSSSPKTIPSRRLARSLDASERGRAAPVDATDPRASHVDFMAELRVLGVDLVDVSPCLATLFVALDAPGRRGSSLDD